MYRRMDEVAIGRELACRGRLRLAHKALGDTYDRVSTIDRFRLFQWSMLSLALVFGNLFCRAPERSLSGRSTLLYDRRP
jgi:hypothetical protein